MPPEQESTIRLTFLQTTEDPDENNQPVFWTKDEKPAIPTEGHGKLHTTINATRRQKRIDYHLDEAHTTISLGTIVASEFVLSMLDSLDIYLKTCYAVNSVFSNY